MINGYVLNIAAQMGMDAVQVSVVEAKTVGCYDVYLLQLSSAAQRVTALVYQSELDILQWGSHCDPLEVRVRSALSRLQLTLRSTKSLLQ